MYKVIVDNLKDFLYENNKHLNEDELEGEISFASNRINGLLEKNYDLEHAFLLSCYLYKSEQIPVSNIKILDLDIDKVFNLRSLWDKLDLLDCFHSDVEVKSKNQKTLKCILRYQDKASVFEDGNVYMMVAEHLEDDFLNVYEKEKKIQLPKKWVHYFAGKPSYEYMRVLGLDEFIAD